MIVIEEPDKSILNILNEALPQAEKNYGNDIISVHISTIEVERSNIDASFKKS